MQNGKAIGIFGLILGLAAVAQAGFRDALKSAAGSALNEAVGASIITQDIPVENGSLRSVDDFKQKNQLTDEEYQQWLNEVTTQLSTCGKWKAVPGISVSGMVSEGKRAKISEDEAQSIFCEVDGQGIYLGKEYVYVFTGSSCLKFNYPTVASGVVNDRGDVAQNYEAGRVIPAIEDACQKVLDGIMEKKARQTALIANAERQKREAEEAQKKREQLAATQAAEEAARQQAKLEREKEATTKKAAEEAARQQAKLEREKEATTKKAAEDARIAKEEDERKAIIAQLTASRSGDPAFDGKVGKTDVVLQWGDSADVLRGLCGIYLEIPTLRGVTDYYEGSLRGGITDKEVRVCADVDVGLFEVTVMFPSQQIGGTVTFDDLVKKYSGKYGKPESLVDESGKVVIGYRWTAKNEVVVVVNNTLTDANGNSLGAFPTVILTNPSMDEKRNAAVKKRAKDNEKARQAESAKALDF